MQRSIKAPPTAPSIDQFERFHFDQKTDGAEIISCPWQLETSPCIHMDRATNKLTGNTVDELTCNEEKIARYDQGIHCF